MTPGVLAVACAAALLYAPVGTGLARQWYDEPATSHGLALVLAAAIVLYRRWRALCALAPAPSNMGFALLAASLLLFTAGTFAGEVFVLRVSAVLSIAAIVLALAGPRHLRLLVAPFALVLLAIPLPATVVTSLTLPLQLLASEMASGLLTSGGITVLREGNILILSNVTLEVAEACSGLRSIVSLMAMIGMFKAISDARLRHAVALCVATLPIAIVGNTLRVTCTGMLAHFFGPGTVRGPVHDLTGYAAFITMGLALMLVYRLLSRRDRLSGGGGNRCESPALAW